MRIKPREADEKLRQLKRGETIEVPEPNLPSQWVLRKVTQRTYELTTSAMPNHPGRIARWEARQVLTGATGW